jgi:hypothetical protein
MYSAILVAHITGAVVTAVVAFFALLAMMMRNEHVYRRAAVMLASLAAFEVVSGTVLAVMSASVSVASICGNIGLYVAAVAALEAVLFMRMKKTTQKFPSMQAVATMGTSLAFLALAAAFGF